MKQLLRNGVEKGCLVEFINENNSNSNNSISKTNKDIKELRKTEFNASYEEHA